MVLKLEVVSLLEILGLKEFQSVTVRGKKVYLNMSDLTAGGNEVVTIVRSSVVSRRVKVVWQFYSVRLCGRPSVLQLSFYFGGLAS